MDQQTKKKIVEIRQLIQKEKYQQALDEAEIVTYKNSKIYQAHLMAGLCYDKLSKYKEAERAYLEVLDLKPSEPNAIKSLCDVYAKTGNDQKSTEFLQKSLEIFECTDPIKYRQALVKLVKILSKSDDLQKIDPIFKRLCSHEKQITEQFVEIAYLYYKTAATNQCFYLQQFELMGILNPGSYRLLQPSAKQRLNWLIIEIVRYLYSVKFHYKMQDQDISNCIVELRQYFPYNSCFLMLLLLDEYCVGHILYSALILQEIYLFLCAVYDRVECCYLNIEMLQPEMYAVCMKLGYEYLAFCREFMVLDENFIPYFQRLEIDAKEVSVSKVSDENMKKITKFILKECREINRISETQNVEDRLEKLKDRIVRLDGSFLEEVIAKMAMNCFVNYEKLNSMKQLLKLKIKRSIKQQQKELQAEKEQKQSIEKPQQEQLALQPKQQQSTQKQHEQSTQLQKQQQALTQPEMVQPHLYKYYFEYLIKIAKLYRILDEQISIYEVMQKIMKNDPNDLKYRIQAIWLNLSRNLEEQIAANRQSQGLPSILLSSLQELQQIHNQTDQIYLNSTEKSALMRKIIVLQCFASKSLKHGSQLSQNFQTSLRACLDVDRSFQNLYNFGCYIFHIHKNYANCLLYLKQAFIINQKHYHLNRMIFISLLKTKQSKQAFAFLQRIYEGFSNVYWINYTLAINALNTRQLESASKYLNVALQQFISQTNKWKSKYKSSNQLSPQIYYKLSFEKLVHYNDFSLLYMIQQNEYKILCDELIVPQHSIYELYPLCSAEYFDNPRLQQQQARDKEQMDLIFKRVRIETQLAENYKLLGRTKSAYNHIVTAYELINSLHTSNYRQVQEHSHILQLFHTYKEYGTLLFYMKYYKQSQAILQSVYTQLTNYMSDSNNNQSMLLKVLQSEIQALMFEVAVKKLQELMKFESYEVAEQYIAYIVNCPSYSTTADSSSLNYYKSMYQLQILKYLHDPNISIQLALQSIERFLVVLNELKIGEVQSDVFYNRLAELTEDKFVLARQALEDYYILKYIRYTKNREHRLRSREIMPFIQLFPHSTQFYIVYAMSESEESQQPHSNQIAAFLKCMQLDRESPLSVDLLASLYLKRRDYLTATKLFLKSLQIELYNPKGYIGLCICLFAVIGQCVTSVDQSLNNQQSKQIIHKCLNKISSYMQFLKLTDPSENYHMLKFMKNLVSDQPLSVFDAKTSLQNSYKATSHKFKNTLLHSMLGDASYYMIFEDNHNIWKQQGMQAVVKEYIRQELQKCSGQISNQMSLEVCSILIANINKQIDSVNAIISIELRIKQMCRLLNKCNIAVNVLIAAIRKLANRGSTIKIDQSSFHNTYQHSLSSIISLCSQLTDKQEVTDQQMKKLQQNCKQSILYCEIVYELKINKHQQKQQTTQIYSKLFDKLHLYNRQLIFPNLPTYQHIETMLLQCKKHNKQTDSQCLLSTQQHSSQYLYSFLPSLKRYIIINVHNDPCCSLLRQLLIAYLLVVQNYGSINLKNKRSLCNYSLEDRNMMATEDNCGDYQKLQKYYKKNVIRSNSQDCNSWIAFVALRWNTYGVNSVIIRDKTEQAKKWISSLQTIIDGKDRRQSYSYGCLKKAENIYHEMKAVLISKNTKTTGNSNYHTILHRLNINIKDSVQMIISTRQLSQQQQQSILLILLSQIVGTYTHTHKLLQIIDLCIKSCSQTNKPFFRLLKFISCSSCNPATENSFMEQISNLSTIISQCEQNGDVHPNALITMKCMMALLSLNYEELEKQLNEAIDNKFVTYSDRMLINYFEILRAFKEVEDNIQGEGVYQNFMWFFENMVETFKQPFYKGFLYYLKAMAESLREGQGEGNIIGTSLKMAALLDPIAIKAILTK